MQAVIMAGGVGTRFWPRSRRARPKQLLPIAGQASMIRLTVDRLLPFLTPDQIWVVTSQLQADGIRRELGELARDHVLIEPVGRNTAPCIGVAAAVLRAQGRGSESMAVLPSDHVITDGDGFRRVLKSSDTLLGTQDVLLTLGIRPSGPETGFGYIRCGDRVLQAPDQGFRQVERFVEKPDLETARRWVADGRHLWNSGMFVWRADRILQELEQHLPEVSSGLGRLQAAWGTSRWDAQFEGEYRSFPSISIDYAVMEKAAEVWVAEIDLGWSDVGSWASLPQVRKTDSNGNVLPAGSLAFEAQRNIVEVQGKTVVLLGVSDLIVVDEPDALLVCHRDQAQQVGRIPEELRKAGLESLT